MRAADELRGQATGRSILDHILDEARGMGKQPLRLETGAVDGFIPACTLHAGVGFTTCGPFETYGPDPFSVFRPSGSEAHRPLRTSA